ncbi:MAG TPA: heme o synthase [bacterium]|nr:heme o synthase [bacterium]
MTTLSLSSSRFSDYMELSKARLVSLVLLSGAVGFYLASPAKMDIPLFFVSLLGTAFVAAGSMSLNQWMERREDAEMARTAARPLPAGRMQPSEALFFGSGIALAGLLILFFAVNGTAAFLAALTLVSYLLLYTPMKRKTSLCTIVGAIPGAIPPLIGWASAAGKTSFEAWLIFTILFLWQMPHFLAIAWICRKEYGTAGFKMLSVTDPSGAQVGRQIILYSLALLPVSLLPSLIGLTGKIYFLGALGLGVWVSYLSLTSSRDLDRKARPFFRTSILYLALLLLLMVMDKAK